MKKLFIFVLAIVIMLQFILAYNDNHYGRECYGISDCDNSSSSSNSSNSSSSNLDPESSTSSGGGLGIISGSVVNGEMSTTEVKNKFLHIKLDVEEEVVFKPATPVSLVDIENFNKSGALRIELFYSIVNSDGEEKYSSQDTVYISSNELIVKNLDANLIPGNYNLKVNAKYGYMDDYLSKEFEVREGGLRYIGGSNMAPMIMGLVLCSLVFYLIFLNRKGKSHHVNYELTLKESLRKEKQT